MKPGQGKQTFNGPCIGEGERTRLCEMQDPSPSVHSLGGGNGKPFVSFLWRIVSAPTGLLKGQLFKWGGGSCDLIAEGRATGASGVSPLWRGSSAVPNTDGPLSPLSFPHPACVGIASELSLKINCAWVSKVKFQMLSSNWSEPTSLLCLPMSRVLSNVPQLSMH